MPFPSEHDIRKHVQQFRGKGQIMGNQGREIIEAEIPLNMVFVTKLVVTPEFDPRVEAEKIVDGEKKAIGAVWDQKAEETWL